MPTRMFATPIWRFDDILSERVAGRMTLYNNPEPLLTAEMRQEEACLEGAVIASRSLWKEHLP